MHVFRHGTDTYRIYGPEYFIEYTKPNVPLQEMIRAKIFTNEIDPKTGKNLDIVLFVERTIANDSYLFSADVGKDFPCIIGHNPDMLVGKVPEDIIAMIVCINPEEIYPAMAQLDNRVIAFESKNKSKVVCGHDFMLTKEFTDLTDPTDSAEIFEDIIDMPFYALDYIFDKVTFEQFYTKNKI